MPNSVPLHLNRRGGKTRSVLGSHAGLARSGPRWSGVCVASRLERDGEGIEGSEEGWVEGSGGHHHHPPIGKRWMSPCCLPISSAFLSPCHLEAFPFPSKPDILVADASKVPDNEVRHDGIVFHQTFFTSVHISLVFRMLDDFVCSIKPVLVLIGVLLVLGSRHLLSN